MARRTAKDRARIDNLRKRKEPTEEVDGVSDDENRTGLLTLNEYSSNSYSLDESSSDEVSIASVEQTDSDDDEDLEKEELTVDTELAREFLEKLHIGQLEWEAKMKARARPVRYSTIPSKQAARTQRFRKAKIINNITKLRDEGYPDIRKFFRQLPKSKLRHQEPKEPPAVYDLVDSSSESDIEVVEEKEPVPISKEQTNTSTPHTKESLSPPSPVLFTEEQVAALHAQVEAFKLIQRSVPIPEHLQAALLPRSADVPRSNPGSPTLRSLDVPERIVNSPAGLNSTTGEHHASATAGGGRSASSSVAGAATLKVGPASIFTKKGDTGNRDIAHLPASSNTNMFQMLQAAGNGANERIGPAGIFTKKGDTGHGDIARLPTISNTNMFQMLQTAEDSVNGSDGRASSNTNMFQMLEAAGNGTNRSDVRASSNTNMFQMLQAAGHGVDVNDAEASSNTNMFQMLQAAGHGVDANDAEASSNTNMFQMLEAAGHDVDASDARASSNTNMFQMLQAAGHGVDANDAEASSNTNMFQMLQAAGTGANERIGPASIFTKKGDTGCGDSARLPASSNTNMFQMLQVVEDGMNRSDTRASSNTNMFQMLQAAGTGANERIGPAGIFTKKGDTGRGDIARLPASSNTNMFQMLQTAEDSANGSDGRASSNTNMFQMMEAAGHDVDASDARASSNAPGNEPPVASFHHSWHQHPSDVPPPSFEPPSGRTGIELRSVVFPGAALHQQVVQQRGQDQNDRRLPSQKGCQTLPVDSVEVDARFTPPDKGDHKLEEAIWRLDCISRSKNLDLFFRARVTSLLAFFRLYVNDKDITWTDASLLAASTVAGRGKYMARLLRTWARRHLADHTYLPINMYGQWKKSIIADEDLCGEIQAHLQSLGKEFLSAQDVSDYLNRPDVMDRLNRTKEISIRTAQKWMNVMGYRYGKTPTGMYIDGHEREDVVKYRQEVFLPLWLEYKKDMTLGDANNDSSHPYLILVTHDESTFYANDQQKVKWVHSSDQPKPRLKGEGASIMVSDFCTPEAGWLKSSDGSREARVYFRAGKNCEGYFGHEDIEKQVQNAINIFEDCFPGCTALFAFDNATTHSKRAVDALSARHMPKFPGQWKSQKAPPTPGMRPGVLPDGRPQHFYFPEDHPTYPSYFKGMALILQERGISAGHLPAECKGFKCQDTGLSAFCCCRRVLFNQPDFRHQKSALEELITSRGHRAIFYPKFHCELNFIEQCWGMAKYHYRMMPHPSSDEKMEENIKICLDSIPLENIKRFANRSARFMDCYRKGLTGAEAQWANKKYHGHRTILNTILDELAHSL